MIGEEIKKIELVQNSLSNYIRINNPIIKTNTVNTLIEEELKKYHFELEEKKIKLFKTLEKDLPETAVPDDQLRYILSCVMQYVTALIPPNGSFGLFTKSLVLQRERGEDQARVQRERRYIEILMGYTGYKKPMEQFGEALGTPARQKQRTWDIALRLVDVIIQRNRGMMKFEEDEKRPLKIKLLFSCQRILIYFLIFFLSPDRWSRLKNLARTFIYCYPNEKEII
jgi:hypothetical protein